MSHYRGYEVTNENGKCVARPTDGDKFAILSLYPSRVRSGIDALHDTCSHIRGHQGIADQAAIDRLPAPLWVREWLADPVNEVDLDDLA